ncbi:MAG: ArsR family transcriptional regulator [Planctomycetota bacterium]
MRTRLLIEALFPKTRREVLAATLMHPERWWFLADLARHIGVTPSSLQREMASLVQAGILLRRQEGKQVYFRPDPSCPILRELQGIITKTVGLLDVLSAALTPFGNSIQCAFVYGSIARAEELSESDVDLMVIGDVGLAEISPALKPAEERLARAVNPTLFSPAEYAKKLRQGHHFLKTVLAGEKLFVLGDENDLAEASRSPASSPAQDQQHRA